MIAADGGSDPRDHEEIPLIADGAGRCTDTANALRLAEHYRDRLIHVPGVGWHAWCGTHWTQDQTAAERLALTLPALILGDVSAIRRLAGQARDEDAIKELTEQASDLAKWSNRTANRRGWHDALRTAEPLLAVDAGQLDRGGWLLNTRTGTVDLETGECRPHKPADLITRIAPVEYDPEADCPEFRRLVSWAMCERPALVEYLQKALGMSATDDTTEQSLFVAFGGGDNAKSTVLEMIVEVLGEGTGGYALVAAPDLLMQAKGERHSTELTDLRGARMVLASETEKGRELNITRVKYLTGGTKLRARKCHKDSVSFTLTSTFWIDTNHPPQIQEQTHAAWRRVKVIPFGATIQPGRKDKNLKGRILRNESSGILNWLIEGAQKWRKDGLGAPPEVQAAVDEYRVASSSVASWRATCCRVEDGLVDRSSALQKSYESYCRTEGIEPVTGRDFKILMVELGHEWRRCSSGVYYHGIATCGAEEGSDPDA